MPKGARDNWFSFIGFLNRVRHCLWIVPKWHHAYPIVTLFSTMALVLPSQNPWPPTSLSQWRHLWTTPYFILKRNVIFILIVEAAAADVVNKVESQIFFRYFLLQLYFYQKLVNVIPPIQNWIELRKTKDEWNMFNRNHHFSTQNSSIKVCLELWWRH